MVGLNELKMHLNGHTNHSNHLEMLSKRAQALEIPVMMIQSSQLQQDYVAAWATVVIKPSVTSDNGGKFYHRYLSSHAACFIDYRLCSRCK